MSAWGTLLSRKKITQRTVVTETTEEIDIDTDEDKLKERVVTELMELDNRVRMMELELELINRRPHDNRND